MRRPLDVSQKTSHAMMVVCGLQAGGTTASVHHQCHCAFVHFKSTVKQPGICITSVTDHRSYVGTSYLAMARCWPALMHCSQKFMASRYRYTNGCIKELSSSRNSVRATG